MGTSAKIEIVDVTKKRKRKPKYVSPSVSPLPSPKTERDEPEPTPCPAGDEPAKVLEEKKPSEDEDQLRKEIEAMRAELKLIKEASTSMKKPPRKKKKNVTIKENVQPVDTHPHESSPVAVVEEFQAPVKEEPSRNIPPALPKWEAIRPRQYQSVKKPEERMYDIILGRCRQ